MRGFDGIGGTIAARVMAAMNVDMERAALAMLEPHDGERFLVVGFGPGLGLVALLDAVTPASLLGIDPSAEPAAVGAVGAVGGDGQAAGASVPVILRVRYPRAGPDRKRHSVQVRVARC
jgi:hypothetical protein